MAIEAIDSAFRRYRILKELIRRERDYTRGYVNLNRLYDIGVLEKGMTGEPRRTAQDTLDNLDNFVDALGFLDITASFEAAAVTQIDEIRADTLGSLRDSVDKAQLPPAAPRLLRATDEFASSLKRVFDLLRSSGDPGDGDQLELINEARNNIAHGRIPPGLPVTHVDLVSSLSRLIDRQVRM